jgi:hypothetical protein
MNEKENRRGLRRGPCGENLHHRISRQIGHRQTKYKSHRRKVTNWEICRFFGNLLMI